MKKTRLLKNFIIFVTGVLIFSGCVRMLYAYSITSRKGDVLLRFAVTSGTYVYDEKEEGLTDFIDKVYAYADKQENNRVDAIIINGNLTGDGSKEAFENVKIIKDTNLRDDTRFFFTTGEDDFSMEDEDNVKKYVLGNSSDYVVNVNGYNFVFWSPIYNSYATKFEWVDSQLEELTKYSERPVFVFQYGVLKDTYYGSDNWYTYESEPIMAIMEKYPTVINFSSAALTPANLQNGIYQKNATYINTGILRGMRMNYNQFGFDASSGVRGPHINDASQGRIVEVYGDGSVSIKIMDVNTGNIYKNPYSINEMVVSFYPGVQETYKYTLDKNQSYDIPFFADTAKIKLQKTEDDVVEIIFSEASDEDGVLIYAVSLFDENKNLIICEYIYSDIALYEDEDFIRYQFEDINIDAIKSVEILPYDVFGKQGEALCKDLED